MTIEREHKYIESSTLGGIIIPLVKLCNYDLYIYGCRDDISNMIHYFQYLGVNILAVYDRDFDKAGTKTVLGNIPVKHVSEITKIHNPENAFFLINIDSFKGIQQNNLINIMHQARVNKFYHINGQERGEINGYFHADWDHKKRIDYYLTHKEELIDSFGLFEDSESQENFIEFLRVYLQVGIWRKNQIDGRYKYFFGDKGEEIYKHLKDEIWVNCGANIGDNIFTYFSQNLTAKKIYAFEGDKSIYNELETNIQLLPENYRHLVQLNNVFIDEKCDLKNLIRDKITLLNADIEGNEYAMLRVLENRIISDRPVIAICVYHKPEDITVIPSFLASRLNNYHFYLRKYEANIYGGIHTQELVLYAIPEERKCR